MLVELLSLSNYGQYNIKVAQILGLESAVYLSELLNINEKALRKNKLEENFFTLDRKYVTERTTLSEEKQLEIEVNLLKIGILEHKEDDPNVVMLNITVLTSILMDPDESLLKDISKITKSKATRKGRETKESAIKTSLKDNIVTTNSELIAAYSDWIDAVYAKQGWMSKKAVILAQQAVDDFSQRNLDVALKLLDIAAARGYVDINWAINAYKKDYSVGFEINSSDSTSNAEPIQRRVRLSSEIF